MVAWTNLQEESERRNDRFEFRERGGGLMMQCSLVRTPWINHDRDKLSGCFDSRFALAQHDKHKELGNHQLAAVLLFQFHGLLQSNDGAFHLAVFRWLRGDALEPQSRLGQKRKH